MREIEAQAIRRDQAALLADMAAEAMAKRRVKQMRAAVVGAGGIAPLAVDALVKVFADCDLALSYLRGERVNAAQRLRCVGNISIEAFERYQFSGVADLPAALPVKRRLVEDDLNFLARPGALHPGAV